MTCLSTTLGFAQKITVETEKTEYKTNEIITLSYSIPANVDSVGKLAASNFRIIDGPSTSSTMSILNGKITASYKATYLIQADIPGTIEILSPTFYLKNQKQKAEKLRLTISRKNSSSENADQLKFNSFKDKTTKPNGTLRYVLYDTYGYIEIMRDSKWAFKRRLTKEEIAVLKK